MQRTGCLKQGTYRWCTFMYKVLSKLEFRDKFVSKTIKEVLVEHPFAELIDLSVSKLKDGYSECILEVEERHFNPHKVVHGGVIYSMADTGMGGALYTTLKKGETCATIEIKISYFKPVSAGSLTCKTQVINRGKRVATLESEIFNNERLVAKAMGTYSIFEMEPS